MALQAGNRLAPDLPAMTPTQATHFFGMAQPTPPWTCTPQPHGFGGSGAVGTDGIHQVGSGSGSGTGGHGHALLWSGTAASAIDLNPTNLTGITDSFAYGVRGTNKWEVAGSAASDELHAFSGTAPRTPLSIYTRPVSCIDGLRNEWHSPSGLCRNAERCCGAALLTRPST